LSDVLSREAWRLLEGNYERVLTNPNDLDARTAMQLGAYFAGVAIESSMLGATHACANPLTTRYGTTHGAALAMLLPTVVRWNSPVAASRYAELAKLSNLYAGSNHSEAAENLAQRLTQLADAGELDQNLRATGVRRDELRELAAEASKQWTGQFNPRPFDQVGALEVYESAY
jgi:alcohol dehydrogenase